MGFVGVNIIYLLFNLFLGFAHNIDCGCMWMLNEAVLTSIRNLCLGHKSKQKKIMSQSFILETPFIDFGICIKLLRYV